MPIRSVLINVADLDASIAFYTRHLDLEVVERDERSAVLDAVTATIRLLEVQRGATSSFRADDLQAGFRHVGFKVSDLRSRAEALQAAGVPFHLEPLHAEGDVDLTFFFDPDGTLLELVEGALQYHEVYDRDGVEADWGLGDPTRPRFDHVAETVEDLARTEADFGALGFTRIAGIHQPNDPRGFEIDFLRDGDASLEVFTFSGAEKTRREPQLDAPGFVAVELTGDVPADAVAVGTAGGLPLVADQDGLVHAVSAP